VAAFAVVALHLFHRSITEWAHGRGHAGALRTGFALLLLASGAVLLFRCVRLGREDEAVTVLTLGLVVFFYFLTHPRLVYPLRILEFAGLGVVLAFARSRARTYMPLVFIVAAALLAPVASNLVMHRGLYVQEMWWNATYGLCGYMLGRIWRRVF